VVLRYYASYIHFSMGPSPGIVHRTVREDMNALPVSKKQESKDGEEHILFSLQQTSVVPSISHLLPSASSKDAVAAKKRKPLPFYDPVRFRTLDPGIQL